MFAPPQEKVEMTPLNIRVSGSIETAKLYTYTGSFKIQIIGTDW